MCMGESFAYMYICALSACCREKPEEDVGSPGTRVTDALSHCVGAGDLLQALWKSS